MKKEIKLKKLKVRDYVIISSDTVFMGNFDKEIVKGKQCYLIPTDCTPQNMVVTQDKKVYLIDLDQLQFFSAPKNSLKHYKHFLKEYLRIT